MLSEISFGSYWSYVPKERCQDDDQNSYAGWISLLKVDRIPPGHQQPLTAIVAERLAAHLPGSPLETYLDREAVLVPVHRSSPLKPGALWPSKRLAEAMVRNGIGASVQELLERAQAVEKAAFGGKRDPEVHRRSFSLSGDFPAGTPLVLVDDVVTSGSTLLGAAACLREAFPHQELRAFAAIRTTSNPNEFRGFQDPVVGQIGLLGNGRTRRRP